ncbi:MAG: exostosin family protein [Mesonia sp.]|uniref:exostosin domain-containing protein n=1 Tax=Mesonia sp. TaxID=1960830 RepID=UPI003241C613
MKLFYPQEHYNSTYRGLLFPLLKAFIKNKAFTDAQRLELYGVSEKDYDFVDQLTDADVVILPMAWNYYVATNQLDSAHVLIKAAAREQKIVWSWNAGDFGVKIPSYDHVKVFRMGGYVSRDQQGHEGMPVFISDRLSAYQLPDHFELDYTKKPIVGFCGQANASVFNAFLEQLKIIIKNLRSNVWLSAQEPQAVLSSTRLRAQLLAKLAASNLITDRFILRQQYRAGVKTKAEKQQTTDEFYQNIAQSAYVLCVRGAGNFSVRFYETLMMGRIPVYVHTDGFLPLSNQIDWRKHVVWVDEQDLHRLDEIVYTFHQRLDADRFKALLVSNRMLWHDLLTLDFFKHIF